MSKADPHRQAKAPSPPAPPSARPPSASVAPPLPPVQASTASVAVKPPATSPPRTTVSPMAPYSAAAAPAAPSAKPEPIAGAVPAAKAAPRPTPAAAPARPAPVSGLAIPAHPAEEPPEDLTDVALKSAPPFLVSMVVHMVLIVVLALVTFSKVIKDSLELKAVYAESIGEQLLDDKLQSPESLDMHVDVPLVAFGLNPADDPLASPPKLSDFFDGASSANSRIEAPSIGFALTGREAGMKKALLNIYGATATTESAVGAGLEWLKKQQMRDGGWSLVGPYQDGAIAENRCAATALALLAFQGYGATHSTGGGGSVDYHDVVERGWNFLLKMQDKDGFFQHEGSMNHRSYAQAQATIAVCEIYGMTKDPKFKRPAQLALDYAHKAQSPDLGGWRYQPRIDSDTSVTGWYVMAFQSGLMAGLEVQSPNLELVNKFLDLVAYEGGTQYAYQIGGEVRLSMTAEALLCRQYLGWKHDDPRLLTGIDQLLANRIDYDDQNVYYWYYATQACHHMDGDDWNRWNEYLRERVPAAQTKTGPQRGSWSPLNDRWGAHGGRLYVTCLSTYLLETYYRHLPIYKWRLN